MSDPVSWFLIEPGWRVLDANGEEIGKVEEVVGDAGKDIFNGLAISASLLERVHYVPSERVREINAGVVHLSLPRSELAGLPEFEEPPASIEVESADPHLVDRVVDVFSDVESKPQPLTPWRRLLNRLFRR